MEGADAVAPHLQDKCREAEAIRNPGGAVKNLGALGRANRAGCQSRRFFLHGKSFEKARLITGFQKRPSRRDP
jgi:hypothetical protein